MNIVSWTAKQKVLNDWIFLITGEFIFDIKCICCLLLLSFNFTINIERYIIAFFFTFLSVWNKLHTGDIKEDKNWAWLPW